MQGDPRAHPRNGRLALAVAYIIQSVGSPGKVKVRVQGFLLWNSPYLVPGIRK